MSIDKKEIVYGSPLVLDARDEAFVFLNKKEAIAINGGDSKSLASPFGSSGSGGIGSSGNATGSTPSDPTAVSTLDIPDLTDIESITYQQYYDTYNSIRYRAIVKIRNSSKKKNEVTGVDAKNENSSSNSSSQNIPVNFVRPSPAIPGVIFDRSGTSIAWGWNNNSNSATLGTYSSVYYEWIISTSSGKSAAALNSGTKSYVTSGSYAILSKGNKMYRVSSAQGDTPATSASRWLRARTVVIGTDGNKYYSGYSTPL